jgi:hypothetical protein
MQVNSVRGSLHNRCFSETGSIGGIHLPDFSDPYVFYRKKSGTGNILRIQNPFLYISKWQTVMICAYGRFVQFMGVWCNGVW